MNSKILKKLQTLIVNDGYTDTYIDEVKLYRRTTQSQLCNVIFENWILFTFQGVKEMKLNNTILEYSSENYLVTSSTLPVECQSSASKEEPFFAMVVSFDLNMIYQLLDEVSTEKQKNTKDSNMGTFTDETTSEIQDILCRIIKIVDNKEDSKILGKSLVKELLYRILKGENSRYLHKLLDNTSNEARISRSLKLIHENDERFYSVEELARIEDMSVSSFHNHFKKITAYTPHQYIRRMRLNKAETLISQENLNVNEVAFRVGYENASQFSKEFKKYFGYPPKEAKKLVQI